jgi:hypothetical protein
MYRGNGISIAFQRRRPKEGHNQRQVRRALVASSGSPLSMLELLDWVYPASQDHPRWHRNGVRYALKRWLVIFLAAVDLAYTGRMPS